MTYLLEVPLEGDAGVAVFEVDGDVIPGELELASDEPGKATARASRTLEEAVRDTRPVLRRVLDALSDLGPTETSIEFGIKIGGETGVIFAKGTAEASFKVTMTWKPPEEE